MTSITKAQAARREAHLGSRVQMQGEVITKREMVARLLARGYVLEACEEPKIKPLSRLAFFRATNEQQQRHERRMKEAGTVTRYRLIMHATGSSYDISKIQYEEGQCLILQARGGGQDGGE